jgi:hypothetical protein
MMKKIDYSKRDQDVKAVLYVLIQKKKKIDLELFDSYWRDVHGPVSARLPGQFQYWQFHIERNQGNIWPVTDEIEYKTAEEDQLDGIAELTFLSEKHLQAWINAAAILGSDEQNFVNKAIIYTTINGNSHTYVDRLETGAPNGGLNIVKLHVMVKRANAVTINDFRNYITETFATNIAKSDLVLKFRLHLLEEHNNSLPQVPGVSHYEPLANQYQAAFEIAFKNHQDMKNFFVSKEYAATAKTQTKYIKQLAAFPERDTYTFVYEGKLTLAGQRTSTVAELIANLGATNQTQKSIANLMLFCVALSSKD